MAYGTIVSTDTLAARGPEWAIVDCRFDLQNEALGLEQYRLGHIPGAVYANLAHDLSAPLTGTNGRHPLPSPEQLVATFGRLGIDRSTQVVAYDQDAGMFASRLWWMLRYMGHDAVAVLDGGWAKWQREARPAASGDQTRGERPFQGSPRAGWAIGVDAVRHRLGDPDVLIVDARAPERFAGSVEPIDRTPGHIPGAVNRPWMQNVDDSGTLRSAAGLREDFERTLRGRHPSQAVMSCGSGVSACFNLLAMEHAGMTGARLYPGSWSEWSADPARPVETGPDARPSVIDPSGRASP